MYSSGRKAATNTGVKKHLAQKTAGSACTIGNKKEGARIKKKKAVYNTEYGRLTSATERTVYTTPPIHNPSY